MKLSIGSLSNFYQYTVLNSKLVAFVFDFDPVTGKLREERLLHLPSHAATVSFDGYVKEWFDAIIAGNEPVHVFSERTVDIIRGEGFTGIEFYPLRLKKIHDPNMRKKPHGQYFWPRIIGKLPAVVCRQNGEALPWDPKTSRYKLDLAGIYTCHLNRAEWDGSDFCYISTIDTLLRFCTQRVVDALKEHKVTNILFYPPKGPNTLII